jgi:hypothetical protein
MLQRCWLQSHYFGTLYRFAAENGAKAFWVLQKERILDWPVFADVLKHREISCLVMVRPTYWLSPFLKH